MNSEQVKLDSDENTTKPALWKWSHDFDWQLQMPSKLMHMEKA